MKIRLFAPVAVLVTGACFATRNDVRILQDDIQRARTEAEQRNSQLQAQQRAVLDSLRRSVVMLLDTLRSYQTQVSSTGGNLRTDQRSLEGLLERVLANLDIMEQRQAQQARELSVLGEQMTAIRMSFATDSTRALPADGPNAKILAAQQQLERGAAGGARELLMEVLQESTDTLVLAEAHKHIADSYHIDQRRAERDSVFQVLYERFPTAVQFASEAMYRHGVSLIELRQFAEAKAILNRVIADYPTSQYVALARARLAEIPPLN